MLSQQQKNPYFSRMTRPNISSTFFWYESDLKLKMFWKDNAMKFYIRSVNVQTKQKSLFLLPKNALQSWLMTYENKQTNKKFNIYTSYFKIHRMVFQNSFSFWPTSSQKFCRFENKFFTFSYCTGPVPQSNFLSAAIFNFDYVFSFGIYCHFVEIFLLHWVCATKESLNWLQKRSKTAFLWPTNDSFVGLT